MNEKIKALIKNTNKKIKALYVKHKSLIWEFIRYCVVGGTAFIFDAATYLILMYAVFIPWLGKEYVESYFYFDAIAITAGFIIGIIVNYILSVLWVFTTGKQKKQGRNAKAFLIFVVIGIIGYFLKLGIMNVGINHLNIDRVIMNFIAAGLVLIWNYLARKIIIFRHTTDKTKKGILN